MKRKLLLALVCMMLGMTQAHADDVWCIETQDGRMMAMKKVAFLLASDYNDTFSIVGKDGTVLNDVTEARFEMATSICDVTEDEMFTQVVGDRLIIRGCAEGLIVTITDVAGKRILLDTVSQSNTIVNVATLPNGLYIVTVGNTAVKFRKG